jgi:hypothetical protein
MTTEGMRIEHGYAVPSQAPGLGIAWDLEAISWMAVYRSTAT